MHEFTPNGVQHVRDPVVVVATKVAATLFGVLGGLAVAAFGALGLIAISCLLAIAVVMRSLKLVLSVVLAAGVAMAAWVVALARCEPTMGRSCTLADGSGLLIASAAIIGIVGIAIGWTIARRPRVVH